VGQDKDQQRIALNQYVGHAKLKEMSKLFPKLKTLIFGSSTSKLLDDYVDSDDDSDEKDDTRHREFNFWDERREELPKMFQQFLRALCRGPQPIILFLDDLHWADQDSLDCINALIQDPLLQNFVLVGTYRDDEPCDIPFVSGDQGQTVTDIYLGNLPLSSVEDILSDLTGTSGDRDLAKIVLEKTHGNPLSIFQFLEMLQRKELLVFSFHTHKWIWDVEQIRIKTEVTQNVGHSLVRNIGKLSVESRKLLTLAAVIGFSFEPKVVELIASNLELLESEYHEHLTNTVKGAIQDAVSGGLIHPDQTRAILATQLEMVQDGSTESLKGSFYEESIQVAIQEAKVEGLIGKAVSRSKCKFSHDLVHKSFYEDTALDIERHKLHLQIGRFLRKFYTARPEDELLFAAVDHMNKGSHFLDSDEERIELIKLNQKSSEKARARSALFSAAKFSSKAIDLLKFEFDWMNHYDLLLHVYNDAAELNFACGRFDLSLRRCLEIHRNAKCLQDKLAASYIRVEVFYCQRKINVAIKSCMVVLESIGEPLPERPNTFQILSEWRKTKKMMKDFDSDALSSLPPMEDPVKRFSQRYLSLLVNMLFCAMNNELAAIAILRMVQNTLCYGSCDFAPFSIAGYGMLCTAFGSFEEANFYGEQALSMCQKMESKVGMSAAYILVFAILHHLRSPLREGLQPLMEGYSSGLKVGEVQTAANCAAVCASMGFHCALPLKSYMDDLRSTCDRLKHNKQDFNWTIILPYWLAAASLTGASLKEESATAETNVFNHMLTDTVNYPNGQLGVMWRNFHLIAYVVSYIFCDYEQAHARRLEMVKKCKEGPRSAHFMVFFAECFSALLDIALYRRKKRWFWIVRAKLQARWMRKMVKNGAVNCIGMDLLLRAELKSLKPRRVQAAKLLYEAAIESFAESGFTHLQAIAYERLAEMLKSVDKAGSDWQHYLRQATKLYAEWGAASKVNRLVEVHRMPARYSMGQTPCPVITINGERLGRSSPMREHGEEGDDLISSDFISSEMLTKKM